jgi:broad specificity phosphatase PhoE
VGRTAGSWLGYRESVPPTTFLVVRHGQSVWNADGRWQGHADPPLSALGTMQAKHAAEALGAVSGIVASDLHRARETAAIIGGHLGVGPVLVDARLREADAGEWTGLTRAEIEAAFPGWLSEGRRPPSFEHWQVVAVRAEQALLALAEQYPGEHMLVVSHSGVIRSLERHLGRIDSIVPNLGGTTFLVDDGQVALGERILLIDHDRVTVTAPRQP